MKRTTLDFYDAKNMIMIMKGIEKTGKKENRYYPKEINEKSEELKELRRDLKKKPKAQREELLEDINDAKSELTELKENYIKDKATEIIKGKAKYEIDKTEIKGHEAFVAKDINSLLICQIIKQELRRSYKLQPANRNMIIEQIQGLIDNPMKKIVIRADVRHFFESIPQEPLINKLEEDGYISKRTLKYLKGMLYKCNEMQGNTTRIGVPRGLSFSSYLSELYMIQVDASINNMDGVYYYKRYVDDIIIIADVSKDTLDGYWRKVGSILGSRQLTLHEDSEKKYLAIFDANTETSGFDYLGYHFSYSNGKLMTTMSQHRYEKYCILIDAIFEIYSRHASYRHGKNRPVKQRKLKKDALHQLLTWIKVLTSNGYLSSRKNHVSTGIYYSNKYLTDLSQLEELDHILYEKINSPMTFCPPQNLFNYGEGNGYAENVSRIKRRLGEFSFVDGFRKRTTYKKSFYNNTLKKLHHIYYSRQ